MHPPGLAVERHRRMHQGQLHPHERPQERRPRISWTAFGVVLLYLGTWLFDQLSPIDFRYEIRSGNSAAAIVLGAVVLAIAALIVTILLS